MITEQASASQMSGGAQRPPINPSCPARDFSALGPQRAPVQTSSATFTPPKAFFNASGLKPTDTDVMRATSNASAEARAKTVADASIAAKEAEQRRRIMKQLAAEDADVARAQKRALERKAELDAELQKWGKNYPLHQEIEMAHQSFLRAVDHLSDGIPQQQVETFIVWFKESVKTRSKSSNNSEVNACAQMVREIKQSLAKLSADCTLVQQEARALHAPQDPESLISMSEHLLAQHQDFYVRFATLEKEMKSVRAAITAAKPMARKAFNPSTLSEVDIDAMAGHSLDAKKKAVKRSVPTLPSTLFAPEGGSSHDTHDVRDVLRERGSQDVRAGGTKVLRERSTKGDFD